MNSSWSLVSSRATTRARVGAKLGELGERRREALRRLEEHHRLGRREDAWRARRARAAPCARQEADEAKAAADDPRGRRRAAVTADAPGIGTTRMPARDAPPAPAPSPDR